MGQRDITSLMFAANIKSNELKSAIHISVISQICRAILNLSLTGHPVESAISSRNGSGGF